MKIKIGVDEVGRGALAGPLLVAAVGIPESEDIAQLLKVCHLKKLTDSKKLSRPQRQRVVDFVMNKVIWELGQVEAGEIDDLGLTKATSLAIERAFQALAVRGYLPSELLLDAGLSHPLEKKVPTQKVIHGDEKIPEISLASILAKVSRDRIMLNYDQQFPGYGWSKNVGYGTASHREQIKRLGLTPLHRRSFRSN